MTEGEQRRWHADDLLGLCEKTIYLGIAVVLIIGSFALLIAQFSTILRLRSTPSGQLMLEVLDGLMLIFIFVELLYAVRCCLRSHEITAEPFLVVGILAGIKEIVVLSKEASELLERGPAFARAAVEIGVLGAVVIALAVAACILRTRPSATEKVVAPSSDDGAGVP